MRAARPASIAANRLFCESLRRPAELEFRQRRRSLSRWTQMSDGCFRIIADDLARIEQVVGIENVLDLLEDSVQSSILRANEGRPGKTVAVFTADDATQRKRGLVQLSGNRFERNVSLPPADFRRR